MDLNLFAIGKLFNTRTGSSPGNEAIKMVGYNNVL